ncbi:hypothetical protein GLOTRDRAFT_118339 [Gloeophyllum trabeum ATCC 11539]|uniref:Transmembrane protein n=1 Tax=Gloeophyllum trabeum (strain ATCC 11539 / FP-39264 / Madison 617) TaxID=670483 RepID=S7PSL6_GLOTA|nr:uncharacterized protein GLOTRDRAFT_118339 [Gloeophyllum trabeum ATCC 11539]EPQ50382.1 hypothetical protein GLOTRDRAFT_118339 [Gloeophyllum trabeum ATCC 11539]
MTSARYEALPTEDVQDGKANPASSPTPAALEAKRRQDPRFNQPAPSIWKRVALIGFVFLLFWLGLHLRLQSQKPKVVHAHRYSKEYKFRPAASPVVTETLKDGRVRLRGAQPTFSTTPSAAPKSTKVSKRTKRSKRSKGSKASKRA